MATVVSEKDLIPHLERTANDSRQGGLYNAVISQVEQVNRTIRNIRLSLPKNGPPLRHLPGQYIDLHIPNISTVGGFTITSPPQTSHLYPVDTTTNTPLSPTTDPTFPYIDLSIQYSPTNPPAVYIWQPASQILNSPVQLRIGGNFHHPPSTLSLSEFEQISNIVLIAGGVGINPVISMICAMDLAGSSGRLGGMTKRVRVLYSSKRPPEGEGKVLFEERLDQIAERYRDSKEVDFGYRFFETGRGGMGRITHEDLVEAVGEEEVRKNTLVYVCGVPKMTDEFVEVLQKMEGLDEKRVLCEKWW